MKKGINYEVFPAKWEKMKSFITAREVGFDGIEFMVNENEGMLTLHSSPHEASVLAEQCNELGLEVSSISTTLHNQYSLTNSDAAVRKYGEDVALKMIELGKAMGIKVIQIVPGVADPVVPYNYAYEWAQESLARLAPEANQAGITLGIENVYTKFLPSPLEFVRFLDEIDHPSIRAYLNIGNGMATGHPEHWVNLLGERIVMIHAKDYKQKEGIFAPALVGDADWQNIMKGLRKFDYTGYVMAVLPKEYKEVLESPVETSFHNLTMALERT